MMLDPLYPRPILMYPRVSADSQQLVSTVSLSLCFCTRIFRFFFHLLPQDMYIDIPLVAAMFSNVVKHLLRVLSPQFCKF